MPSIMASPTAFVAPFTGAWIETSNERGTETTEGVAPFTGAWIETVRSTAKTY